MWKSACVGIHQLLKRNNVLVQVCKRTREICALCNTRSLRYLTNITDHFLLAYFLYKRTPLSLLCGTNAVWSNKQHLSYQIRSIYNVKKSKGVPWQAEVAQGVPGRLRSRIFSTFWHYKGGRSSAKHTDCLYPRRNPWYSLSEAESTSGHKVLSGVPRKKSPVTPPGIDPGTIRLVAQHLNH